MGQHSLSGHIHRPRASMGTHYYYCQCTLRVTRRICRNNDHALQLFLPLNDMPDTLKRLNVFIKGANKLFWLDLESSTKRFYAIYLVGPPALLTDHI